MHNHANYVDSNASFFKILIGWLKLTYDTTAFMPIYSKWDSVAQTTKILLSIVKLNYKNIRYSLVMRISYQILAHEDMVTVHQKLKYDPPIIHTSVQRLLQTSFSRDLHSVLAIIILRRYHSKPHGFQLAISFLN